MAIFAEFAVKAGVSTVTLAKMQKDGATVTQNQLKAIKAEEL